MNSAEELRADIDSLTDTVKRFTQDKIAPHVAKWEEAGEVPRELYGEAAAVGLLGLGYPEELGGTPAPYALRNAVSTTMAHHAGSGGMMASLFSLNIGLPPVLRHGSQAVQQEVIPPVLRGEKLLHSRSPNRAAARTSQRCARLRAATATNG
jgi:acyl-CoA dehydrogenase